MMESKNNDGKLLGFVQKEGSQEELAVLYSKLTNVMQKIGTIPKNGYNKHFDYNYSTAEDVKNAIRPLLAQENIWVSSNVIEEKTKTFENSSGTVMTKSMVTMDFGLNCGDNGARVVIRTKGVSLDNSDKYLYKAFTGATKYFYINNFALDAADDPEMDSYSDEVIEEEDVVENTSEEKNKDDSQEGNSSKSKPKKETNNELSNNHLADIKQLYSEFPDIVEEEALSYLDEIGKKQDLKILSELEDDDLINILDNINKAIEGDGDEVEEIQEDAEETEDKEPKKDETEVSKKAS